jgi:hypothetical protein
MNKKIKKQLVLIISVFILLISCNFSDFSLGSSTKYDEDGKQILFEDNFANPNSGWYRHRGDGVTDYEDGVYHIFINESQQFSWSYAGQNFENEIINVEVAFGGGVDLAEIGIICRMETIDNFYFATIRTDGFFALFKMDEGKDTFLGMDSYQESDAINEGVATNSLSMVCDQNFIRFSVNGRDLIQVEDDSYSFGDVGLIGGTFADAPDVHIYFDEFQVLAP